MNRLSGRIGKDIRSDPLNAAGRRRSFRGDCNRIGIDVEAGEVDS
jgi:hypothetical protein